MGPPQHWLHHKFFLSAFFLLIVNLLALDLLVGMKLLDKTDKKTTQLVTIPTPTAQLDTQTCPPTCLSAINEVVAYRKLTLSPTPQSRPKQALQPTAKQTPQAIVSSQKVDSVKEFFVPLGSGSSNTLDWADVPGVKAEVDNTRYATIQKVLFEASVHVPNANEIVEVRLYNETDKYVVGNSEFLYPSGTSQNFRIAEIQLGQGAKTYKVQMKTQLKFPAMLDQARIHITTY